MMNELPLDINSPCTCQSLAYTPSCQHQQSLPSRSILAGEESSGKGLFVWRVNFHKSRVANNGNLELLKESLILISGKVIREKIDELVSIKPRWKNFDHNAKEKAKSFCHSLCLLTLFVLVHSSEVWPLPSLQGAIDVEVTYCIFRTSKLQIA